MYVLAVSFNIKKMHVVKEFVMLKNGGHYKCNNDCICIIYFDVILILAKVNPFSVML